MEGINKIKNPESDNYDPFLDFLWSDYGFKGRPPFAGSVAEKRLKEACDQYANCLDRQKNKFAGEDVLMYGEKNLESSETRRRELHNQIALMVVGRQRSGMSQENAVNIANFAYEYSKGHKRD